MTVPRAELAAILVGLLAEQPVRIGTDSNYAYTRVLSMQRAFQKRGRHKLHRPFPALENGDILQQIAAALDERELHGCGTAIIKVKAHCKGEHVTQGIITQ